MDPNLIVGGLLLVVYFFSVRIVWRNSKFSQPWRAIFAASLAPVFLFGMFFNIWFTENYAPFLIEHFQSAKWQRQQTMMAFAISTPVALVIAYLWYRLLRIFGRAPEKQ